MEEKKQLPLWTRNFTIITLGSVVSLCGNAMSGFAMSLLVLDYTQSSLLYAIYIAVFTLPQIFAPVLSGAVLDRFSRRKTIYTLDFISAGLYAGAALVLKAGVFSFPVLTVFVFFVGTINSIYTVAYQSFYPLLITEGNFSRAYSISSVLETLAALVVPLAAFAYNSIGIVPLFLVNSVCFLIAATAETRIDAEEKYLDEARPEGTAFQRVTRDVKDGFRYLASEKGLLAIGVYFFFCMFASGASNVIGLPYFKMNFENGEYIFMMVFGMSMIGRGLGGLYHYRRVLPAAKKFAIALIVYVTIALIDGFYLFLPVPVMMGLFLISGLLSVTSYTIRISSTQSYVPDGMKGRFNGAFAVLSTLGSFTGELLAGALTQSFSMRAVLAGFMLLNALTAVIFIGGGRRYVKEIYNRQS